MNNTGKGGYMKKQCLSVIITLLLIITVVPVLGVRQLAVTPSTSVSGDDWPQFRHDASHSGFSLSVAPSTKTVLWNKPVGAVGNASPVTADGNVYVSSSDGYVFCLDGATGDTRWVSENIGSTLNSDPGFTDNRVYISAEKLYCFNATSGAELWNTTEGAFAPLLTLLDGKIYLGAGSLSCVNAENGSLLWSFTPSNMSVFTSPAVADENVYVGESADQKLYCILASNGTPVWNITLNSSISVTPAVVDGRVYIGTSGGQILCVNGLDGGMLWEKSVGAAVHSSFAVAYGNVYVGCDDQFFSCYNATSGDLVWTGLTGGPIASSPLVADKKVYVSSDKFYCFNALNGASLWNFSTGGGSSSPAILNGKVYVTSDAGLVYCFKNLDYPPASPSAPAGPIAAGANIPLNFTTVTTDPEGDQVYYLWDWDEPNMTEDWIGPFASGQPVTVNHTYFNESVYNIRVKAKDLAGNESSWSDAHTITIAPQVSISRPRSGNLYLLFPRLNYTFFYSPILDGLGVSIVLTKTDLFIEANATTVVQRVMFEIYDMKTNETIRVNDTNASDGFTYHDDVFRGVFQITVLAYDANNTFIDWNFIPFILFFRFNSGSSLLAERLYAH
jgi:outer membrane protein assembly factor BamB